MASSATTTAVKKMRYTSTVLSPMSFISDRWVSNHLSVCAIFYLILNAYITPSLQNKKMHTQSPYLRSELTNLEDKWYKLPGFLDRECFAVQSSSVVRNGISFPPDKLIKEIVNIHRNVVEAMDLDVNSKLYEWNNPFTTDKAGWVLNQGRHEQLTLGKKIALKLISLYGSEDIGDVTFLTSSQTAPKQSAQSFYSGFFHGVHGGEFDDDEMNYFDTEVDDKLLRYFDRCPSSKRNDTNKESSEFNKFLTSEHVRKIKMKITDALGIQKDVLTNENIWHIYLICGYEQANFGSSPWCSLFDEEDLDVFEYLGDLKLYYTIGFGSIKSWPHGCLLLTEIFTAMEEAIDEIEGLDINEDAEGYNVGLFAFAQAETLANFMSAMGLFNDTSPLRADNFETHQQRSFRGGKILPFSANIMLVLYECAPDDYRAAEASYLVKLFVNEKATLIPGCSNLHCPFQQIKKHYQFLTDDCNSKKLCGIQPKRDEL